jgi:hypothetical protein
MAPAAFPPPIFIDTVFVLWYHVSLPPPHAKTSGSHYKGFLSHHRQSEIKTDDIGGMMAKQALVAQPG